MELHPSLRDNVRLLGDLLGQIMVTDRGGAFLQRIERLRSGEKRFLASAAHEMQTPLAGLRTHADIALRASDGPTRERALERIRQSVDRTARLVRQLRKTHTLFRVQSHRIFYVHFLYFCPAAFLSVYVLGHAFFYSYTFI